MINKRLLIKNLLAHNDENSFYDKKRKLNLGDKEGKAKFLKHVCALSNSNPFNNSYLVVGVEDRDNSIVGVDFYDDSKIQNLVNAYLKNPPKITYENILFPHLPNDKVVGLVIIRANHGRICSLRKNIWKYYGGAVFSREGSISMPQDFGIDLTNRNSKLVASIESHSQNTIEYTLDGVFDFMHKNRDYHPSYKVFQEYFVVCWAGKKKVVKNQKYYSRVNIELINEQVKLFYSDLDEISIFFAPDEFKIIEYVYLGLYENYQYYPLEEVKICFKSNMSYEIESKILFEPPQFSKKTLYHIYMSNTILINKISKNLPLSTSEEKDIKRLPDTLLLCYLNGIESAFIKLNEAKSILKSHPKTYQRLKDNLRILRKIRYS